MANIFKTTAAHLSDASTDAYTCPVDTTAVVIGAQAANVHLAATPLDALVSVGIVFDGGVDTFYLVRNLTVPVGSAIDIVTGKVALAPGDKLIAMSDVDVAIDLLVTVLEIS